MMITNKQILNLLIENQSRPKAIFLAGPAGSGKSYISSKILPNTFSVINSDTKYEDLLKKNNLGLKQKDFNSDELSLAAKLQYQARKLSDEDYKNKTSNKQNIIIDGTGGSSNSLIKKKKELESLGYDTFMIMIYVPLLVSLKRNSERDRSLRPGIILRTWKDVNNNIDIYSQEFKSNFILINNTPDNEDYSVSYDKIVPYLEDSKAVIKPKTKEEEEKSKKEFLDMVNDIINLHKKLPTFTDSNQTKQIINNFILK